MSSINIKGILTPFDDDLERAQSHYRSMEHRNDNQGWLAAYRLAQMQQVSAGDSSELRTRYRIIFDRWPEFSEPLYQLALLHRKKGEYSLGQLYASQGMKIKPRAEGCLSKENFIYEYGLALEYAVCSYFMADHRQAVTGANRALRSTLLSSDLRNQLIDNRRLSLDALFPETLSASSINNPIKVICCFRNAGDYVLECVESLKQQDYPNFEAIFVDDASTDDSWKHIPIDDHRFRLIRHPERRGALYGQIHTALEVCGPDEIVVRLDGDDSLVGPDALTYINDYYNRHQCWVMYGQFQYSDARPGTAMPVLSNHELHDPQSLFELGFPLHPITYRVALLRAMQANDENMSFFKYDAGDWFMASTDLAQAVCLLQSAGIDKIRYNDKVLYRYNIDNPHLTSKNNRAMQKEVGNLVCLRKPLRIITGDEYALNA